MKFPKEKLDEIEYYEQHLSQGHNTRGIPYAKDVFVLHFGEYEKEYKLFGFTIWTEVIPDRKEKITFERERHPNEGGKTYKMVQTKAATKFRNQLEAYFDEEFYQVYKALKRHEIDFMT